MEQHVVKTFPEWIIPAITIILTTIGLLMSYKALQSQMKKNHEEQLDKLLKKKDEENVKMREDDKRHNELEDDIYKCQTAHTQKWANYEKEHALLEKEVTNNKNELSKEISELKTYVGDKFNNIGHEIKDLKDLVMQLVNKELKGG